MHCALIPLSLHDSYYNNHGPIFIYTNQNCTFIVLHLYDSHYNQHGTLSVIHLLLKSLQDSYSTTINMDLKAICSYCLKFTVPGSEPNCSFSVQYVVLLLWNAKSLWITPFMMAYSTWFRISSLPCGKKGQPSRFSRFFTPERGSDHYSHRNGAWVCIFWKGTDFNRKLYKRDMALWKSWREEKKRREREVGVGSQQ